MARYTVCFQVYAQTFVEVDAANEEEAREKAEAEVEVPSLCHQCCGPFEINDLGDIMDVELSEES
jgi:hypothetical protein